MKPSANKVLQYLYGKQSLDAIPVDDLKKLAKESPYFPITQFLLAEKLKIENDGDFLKHAEKAALYFSNPYWFHYQITNEVWHGTSQPNDLIETERFTEVLPEKSDEGTPVLNDPTKFSEHNSLNERLEQSTQPEEEIATITRDTDPGTEDFINELNTTGESFVRDNLDEVILETQSSAALEATENLEEMAGTSAETDESTEKFLSEIQPPVTEDVKLKSEQTTAVPPFLQPATNETGAAKTEPDEHERMFLNIKAMLDATSEEADADVENAVIPIDPYYTIDYFASQGIKLDLDANPKDELGQHLKKFTQWLKHMKKLGPEDATEVINRTDTEADVQKIAESSNTVREVVTEAMASVLEKQGKNDKAIELYKKLSFLNPDKSAYFAAKIKNLKGI